MSDKRFAIGITIGASLAGGFSRTTGDARRELGAVGAAVDQLDRKRRVIEKFQLNSSQVQKLGTDLSTAQQKLKTLQQTLRQSPGDSGIKKEVEAAGVAVGRLSALLEQQRRQLGESRAALKAVGLDTGNLRQQNERLANSIKQVEQAEARRVRVARTVQGVATAAVGGVAGAAVLARPTRAAMGYEYRIANLANTAYAGESLDARRAGMTELKEGIHRSIREGGGNRDQAADTLDALVASGAFGDGRVGIEKSLKMLPTLQKYGSASGTDSTQLAQIAIAASRFNISERDLPQALDMAIRAGQLGGFELRDMAKWLPQQMAAGRQSGLSGMEGFAKILAANQASRTTAGTVDGAGNNLVNWLAKINSNDTQKDVKRATGLDLPRYLAEQRGQGVDSMTAFIKLIDGLAAKDKQYVALRKRASVESETDKRATIEQMSNILQGSAVGQIIQDREALMSLLAMMNNRQYVREIEEKIDPRTGAAIGTGQANFDLMKTTGQFNVEQLSNEKNIAQDAAFSKLMPSISSVTEGMTEIARQYPLMTTAAVATTTALTALAAAAGGSTIMRMIFSRGLPSAAGVAGATKGGIVNQALSKAGGMIAGTTVAGQAAGIVGRIAGVAGKALMPLALAKSAWDAGAIATDATTSSIDKKVAFSGLAGNIGGGLGGMATGAALGSVVPVVGTIMGGLIGGVLGSMGGEKIGKMTGEAVFRRNEPGKLPLPPDGKNVPAVPLNVEKKTTLQASYQLNVNGLGMREVSDMIDQRIARLQQEQESRLRTALHDGIT